MIRNGFKDSFREVHPDIHTRLEGTYGFLNEDIISDRIDYIYYRGEKVRAIESDIIQDDPPGGFFNSDHHAVITIFKMN
jgi:exonuclease III